MKTILSTIAFIVSFVASAQNVAVLTHGAANSDEFKRGCPGEYPRCWKYIGKETKIPDGFDSTWVVMTNDALDTRFKELEAAKEAWNLAQESVSTAPKRDRDALIRQAKADMTVIVESSGTLTAAQLSNAVRSIARTLRSLIEDLGY